jgi:hypothetical protein
MGDELATRRLRGWVSGAVAGAITAWVGPALDEAWELSRFHNGFHGPPPTILEVAQCSLALVNTMWGCIGLAIAFGLRLLVRRHLPRTWAAAAILGSVLVVGASLWSSVDWHIDGAVWYFDLTPSMLGFSIGAALFAFSSERMLDARLPPGWLTSATRALGVIALVSAGVLCAYEWHYLLALRSWDRMHGVRGYPLSLCLIWAITGVASLTLGSWRRALLVVAFLTLPFVLMRWVPSGSEKSMGHAKSSTPITVKVVGST